MRNKNLGERFIDASFRAKEGAENGRRFELSFSSEEPYMRWFGNEVLSHGEGNVDLTRLNSIGVVLYNHNRDAVVGRIEKAWIEDRRGKAEIVFDDDEDSEKVYKKVQSGTLKGVSVGYSVDSWEEVAAGKKSSEGFDGPCSVALKWTPLEISIVSVPADATVGVGREYDTEEHEEPSMIDVFEKQVKNNQNYLNLLK